MLLSQVSTAVKIQVHQKIAECISKIEQHYNVKLHRPKVSFQRKGTIAAVANSHNWIVDFNPILLNENVEEFIASTVPHEVAHLACDVIYPEANVQGRRGAHGSRWQELMRLLGVEPKTRHNYDVSTSKCQRKSTKYRYTCTCCNKNIDVGPRRHATLQANPKAFWHTVCGVQSDLIYTGPIVTQPPKSDTRKVQVKDKIGKCYELFTKDPSRPREDIIADFMKAVNCTHAGAATYLRVCKMWLLTTQQDKAGNDDEHTTH